VRCTWPPTRVGTKRRMHQLRPSTISRSASCASLFLGFHPLTARVGCAQHTAFDGDKTSFARFKDFYVPKPPLKQWEGEKAKPPGSTITPREWQELLEEGSADAPGPTARRASFGHDPGQDNVEVLLDGTCRRVRTADQAPCALSPRGLLAVVGPALCHPFP